MTGRVESDTLSSPTRADFRDRLPPWVGEVGSPKPWVPEAEGGRAR